MTSLKTALDGLMPTPKLGDRFQTPGMRAR
jgi:hypothetical protein